MPLVTGTTECTTLGEPFSGSDGGGGGGSDGGSIPAVNDAGVLILPRCNIAHRWRSHGRGLAFSARFAVARGTASRPIDTSPDVENSAFQNAPRRRQRRTPPRRNKDSLTSVRGTIWQPDISHYGHRERYIASQTAGIILRSTL